MKLSITEEYVWEEVSDLNGKAIKGFNIRNTIDKNIQNIKEKCSEKIVCNEIVLEPGVKDIYHFHKFAYDIFRVQSGTLIAVVNKKSIKLNPGTWLLVEPGEGHYITNQSNKNVVLQEIRLFVKEGDKFVYKESNNNE